MMAHQLTCFLKILRDTISEVYQVCILNQQIFELFSRVEKLTNEINAYFIGGNKEQGIEAARTAGQIEKRQRTYVKKAEEIP